MSNLRNAKRETAKGQFAKNECEIGVRNWVNCETQCKTAVYT